MRAGHSARPVHKKAQIPSVRLGCGGVGRTVTIPASDSFLMDVSNVLFPDHSVGAHLKGFMASCGEVIHVG